MNNKRTKKMPNKNFIIKVLLFLIFFIVLTFECYAGTCSDSDGGKNYYTKGSCLSGISGSTFTDYCTTNTKVKEFYCNPSVDDGCWNIGYSKTGYICQSGKLVEAAKCTDTDGGVAYYTKGTATSATGAVRTDYCTSTTTVKEFYCGSDELVYNTEYSRTGYKCENGRLVVDSGTCTDTDGGDKPYTQGVVTSSINGQESDRCGTSDTKLIEYYCDSENKAAYKVYTAPDGYVCSNGRFVEEDVNPITCPDEYCDEDGGETYINCPEDCVPPSEECSPGGYPDCYCDILMLCNSGYVKTSTPCKKLGYIAYCCCPETVDTCGTSGHTACEPEEGENSDNCPGDCGLGVCTGDCYCDVIGNCDKPGLYIMTSTSCSGNGGSGYCCCLEGEIGGCGDETCDPFNENCETCPEDCACIPPEVCVNGECVDGGGGSSCDSCSPWVNQGCGDYPCSSNYKHYTRTCPADCDEDESKCTYSSSCVIDDSCDGIDTSCGISEPCDNCDDLDGCNGAYYDDYHCVGTSCALKTHTLDPDCANLNVVVAVSNFYNKGVPVVLLNISNPSGFENGNLILFVHDEDGDLVDSCIQVISLTENKLFFGTPVKNAHFYQWAESMLLTDEEIYECQEGGMDNYMDDNCKHHDSSKESFVNSVESEFYSNYPNLLILENTQNYLDGSDFVDVGVELSDCMSIFSDRDPGIYDLTASLEVIP